MGMLSSFLNKTAVYWPSPVADGFGKLTFGTPIEIEVVWQDKMEIFLSVSGKQEMSRALVWADQDLELEAYFYLGELGDLSTAEKSNPALIETAYPIKAFRKLNDIGGSDYVRKAWL